MDKCSFLSPKKKKNNVALLYVIIFGAPTWSCSRYRTTL